MIILYLIIAVSFLIFFNSSDCCDPTEEERKHFISDKPYHERDTIKRARARAYHWANNSDLK